MVPNCVTSNFSATSPDPVLVDCAAAGNPTAWNCLIRRHEKRFFRLAMSVVKDEAAAFDVVQSALLSMYTRIDTFDGRGAFSSWSNRVVYNAALMYLRRNKRRREVALASLALSPGDADVPGDEADFSAEIRRPDHALNDRELGGHILDAIDGLEPKYREIIELREFGGLSMRELGARLGLSVGGAKTRLHRARDFLRVALVQHYPELAA